MRYAVLVMALLFGSAASLSATTYLVRPDGTGDFPTIQAAIDAAADGDILELADGTFTGDGNRDMNFGGKAITIRSQSGQPEPCVIDCEGSLGDAHRAFYFCCGEGADSVIENVTITGGWLDWTYWGGAIVCRDASSPTIDGCWFYGNLTRTGGGCLAIEDGSSPQITHCRFTQNDGGQHGGGINVSESFVTVQSCEFIGNHATISGAGITCAGGGITVLDCVFIGNTTDGAAGGGAAVAAGVAEVYLENCLFADNDVGFHDLNYGGAIRMGSGSLTMNACVLCGNQAPGGGGALSCQGEGTAVITSCTFSHNAAPLGGGIHVVGYECQLENTIVTFSTLGEGLYAEGAVPALTCCDLFANEGGDWVGVIADQLGTAGNIAADPLFCGPEEADFQLDAASPCAEENSPECGRIGALGVGCEQTPAERASWGAIKAIYRAERP